MRIGETLVTERLTRILEHESGDLTCTVEAGHPALPAPARARPSPPTAGARPTRRPVDRRAARAKRVRSAPASLRGAARPGARRDARARRRHDRKRGRQGGQECRRLRPREARVRLGRHAGADRRRVVASATRSARVRDGRRRDGDAGEGRAPDPPLAPPAERARRPPPRSGRGAVRGLGGRSRRAGRHPLASSSARRRWTARCGTRRASARRSRAGVSASRPGELEETLARLDEAVVRPASGVAYVPHPVDTDLPASVRALNRAVKAQFDPQGIFV